MKGWYYEGYRHALAAKGIRTSFSSRSHDSYIPFHKSRLFKEIPEWRKEAEKIHQKVMFGLIPFSSVSEEEKKLLEKANLLNEIEIEVKCKEEQVLMGDKRRAQQAVCEKLFAPELEEQKERDLAKSNPLFYSISPNVNVTEKEFEFIEKKKEQKKLEEKMIEEEE